MKRLRIAKGFRAGQLLRDVGSVVPTLEGWCSVAKAQEMAGSVFEEDCQAIVELGVFGGRSLVPLAMACRAKGSGRATGVDPWTVEAALDSVAEPENRDWWSKVDLAGIRRGFEVQLRRLGLEPWVRILAQSSQHALASLGTETIDFLHIDSNHSETVSVWEVSAYLPLVRPGGIVVLDDIDWPTVDAARAIVCGACDPVTGDKTWAMYRKR